jgi:putative ABC transport system substrate-binding protein
VAQRVLRRDVISLIGGAAMVWPRIVLAQSSDRMRRIGVLTALAEDDAGWRRNFAGFKAGLKDAGWVEGYNCRIEFRYVPGGGGPERFMATARELVATAPDVILAVPGQTAGVALLREIRSIPIVFLLSGDPVREGLVTSIAHPAGNATGFTQSELSLGGKWLQLLKEIAPNVMRAAIVVGQSFMSGDSTSQLYLQSIDEAAHSTSVTVSRALVHDEGEIENVLNAVALQPNGGLIVPPDSFTAAHRAQIILLATRLHLPAVYFARFFASDGGLLSYGIDQPDLFRQGGGYVDRILRGAKAGDLPVQAPKKFELVVNLKTAKALGLTIPPALLARADEVIE